MFPSFANSQLNSTSYKLELFKRRIDSSKVINSIIIAGLDVVDTCSDEQTAAWQIIKTLGRSSLDGAVNKTNPLRVILASQLNVLLSSKLSQLSSLSPSLVSPLSSPAMTEAAASLVTSLGWSQVVLVTQEMVANELKVVLAARKICVLASAELPRGQQDKDVYTGLLSGISETGVSRVLVSGAGEDIARLVRNVYELSLNMSIRLTQVWLPKTLR